MLNRFISLAAGIKALFQRQRMARELDEEIAGFLEASVAHNVSKGMPLELARRTARVEMGSSTAVRQQMWESRWESVLDSLLQDVRFGVRSLTRSPGFSLVALLSLGLGIGANTAIFTLVRQVLIQELPVQEPQELVTFGESENGGIAGGIDIGQFGLFPWYFARQLEANPGPFKGIAAFGSFADKVSVRLPSSASSSSNALTILAPANLVSGNYFQVLGAQALLGRTILPLDAATPGSGAVVVLSHHFWQRFLAPDPAIIGQSLIINGTPFMVVGIMPGSFQGIKIELEPTALWTPVSMQSTVFQQPSLLTPKSDRYFLHMFGRLSSGVALGSAAFVHSQAWLNRQIHDGIREYEGSTADRGRAQEIESEVVPLIPAASGVSSVRGQYGESLRVVMAVVVFVLLIACANLTNFLLARAANRQREIATRLALGSSRARIVRQSLIETLLLSLSGGALGLGVAFLSTRMLIGLISRGTLATSLSPTPDLTVLLFTLTLCVTTALLFGIAPALIGSRSAAALTLSGNTRTAQGGSGGSPARFWPKALVTTQVTLSVVLLVGAGLFVRTLLNLQNQDYGIERAHLVVAQFNARLAGYRPAQTTALHQRLVERLSTLPGVRSVALAASAPINPGGWSSTIAVPGYIPAPRENMVSILNRVSDDYFSTVGIPILAGRAITNADALKRPKVAVVNQTLANRYFPRGDAVGQSLTLGIESARGPWRIVGIARDTRSGNPRDTGPIPMTYLPLAQMEPFLPVDPSTLQARDNQDRFADVILVRTTGDPAPTIASLRSAVSAVDANLPLLSVATIQEEISNFISHDELISTLTALFSLLALFLAAIGLYGVMTYNVARRRTEIGIRLALGAQGRAVRWMVLRESLVLLAIGLTLGLPLALVLNNLIKHQLFGLSASDPATFAVAVAVLAGMTLMASWLPARDAGNVDPIIAIRAD